jgi:hypothetical protein
MSDDIKRVLDLLAEDKITVDEAAQLLDAIRGANDRSATSDGADAASNPRAPRFLRINVHKASRNRDDQHSHAGEPRDVNIRVPLTFVRSGMRLGAIVPGLGDRITAKARERGIDLDLNKMDAAQIHAMLRDLGEMTIDVDEGRQQVRIFCE